jgi:hypothetical protein
MATEEAIRDAFKFFDEDNSGALSEDALTAIFQRGDGPDKFSRERARSAAQEIIRRFDTNADGLLQYREFCTWWAAKRPAAVEQVALEQVALAERQGELKVAAEQQATAAEQNVNAKAAGQPLDLYFTLDGLLASVKSGAIRPLRGQWVLALHKRGGQLQRRQDLPNEAFWTADELQDVAVKLGNAYGVLFVALSYRWLSSTHPDPDSFHLGILAHVAELYLTGKVRGHGEEGGKNMYYSPLVEAFANAGLSKPDFALFWDYRWAGGLLSPPYATLARVWHT